MLWPVMALDPQFTQAHIVLAAGVLVCACWAWPLYHTHPVLTVQETSQTQLAVVMV